MSTGAMLVVAAYLAIGFCVAVGMVAYGEWEEPGAGGWDMAPLSGVAIPGWPMFVVILIAGLVGVRLVKKLKGQP